MDEDLARELNAMALACTGCGACVSECSFLRTYGLPRDIAANFNPANPGHLVMSFACSLCGLCDAVCPEQLHPASLFLAMRREALQRWGEELPQHRRILSQERRNTSKLQTYCALPEACDTVFFPGCALPDSRPATTFKLLEWLRGIVTGLGVVLDCCAKPSRDVGRQRRFNHLFHDLRDMLVEQGVRRVITACPGCYQVFAEHGSPLAVRMVYEVLRDRGAPPAEKLSGVVRVHDPCTLRNRMEAHQAVRALLLDLGLVVEEMRHAGQQTLCCGEGAGVSQMVPEFAEKWAARRFEEAQGRLVVGYCAGCVEALGRSMPSCHLLDLYFAPQKALAGKQHAPPLALGAFNRLRFKARLARLPGMARFPRRDS